MPTYPGMGLGSALPSTPGYVGIYQFVTVGILTPFGVRHDDALAYSFVSQALNYAIVLVLGLPGLYRFKHWRQAIAPVGPASGRQGGRESAWASRGSTASRIGGTPSHRWGRLQPARWGGIQPAIPSEARTLLPPRHSAWVD